MILTGKNVRTKSKTCPSDKWSNKNPHRQEIYKEYEVKNEIIKHIIIRFVSMLCKCVLGGWTNLCQVNKTVRKHF
jgi:hypothetical protein